MVKRKIFYSLLLGLFIIYLPIAINWTDYLDNYFLLAIIFCLALLITIFSIKIIINKENNAEIRVTFSFVLLSTIVPLIFPFILLFGLWLDRP